MSRKVRTEAEEGALVEETPADDVDLHGFWDRANLDDDENDEAFAIVIDADGDQDEDAEIFADLGQVTNIDADELAQLAAWAEAKACRNCRRRIREHHDPEQLRHDECRTALRVSRLLRRYH